MFCAIYCCTGRKCAHAAPRASITSATSVASSSSFRVQRIICLDGLAKTNIEGDKIKILRHIRDLDIKLYITRLWEKILFTIIIAMSTDVQIISRNRRIKGETEINLFARKSSRYKFTFIATALFFSICLKFL